MSLRNIPRTYSDFSCQAPRRESSSSQRQPYEYPAAHPFTAAAPQPSYAMPMAANMQSQASMQAPFALPVPAAPQPTFVMPAPAAPQPTFVMPAPAAPQPTFVMPAPAVMQTPTRRPAPVALPPRIPVMQGPTVLQSPSSALQTPYALQTSPRPAMTMTQRMPVLPAPPSGRSLAPSRGPCQPRAPSRALVLAVLALAPCRPSPPRPSRRPSSAPCRPRP